MTFFDSQPSSNNSARIDFRNNLIEATIAAWEYGDVILEAYYVPAHEFIPIQIIKCQDDIANVLDKYLEVITNYPDDMNR